MVRTVGLGLPQQSHVPSASATSSTSTAQHLPRHLEALERIRPPASSPSTIEKLLSEAFQEFEDIGSSSATSRTNAIPQTPCASASMLEAQLTPDTIEHFDPLIRSGIDRAIAVISPNDYTIDISAETINHLTLRRNANTTPSTTSLAAATSTASATSATASSPPSPFRSGNAHAQICASDILPHGHRPPVPSPNLLSTAHTSELGVEQEFAQSMHPTLPPSILKRPASTSVPAHPGARQQGVL